MMRTDGHVAFYLIQMQFADDEWKPVNIDHFGLNDYFSASDHVWQRYGVWGTQDLETARAGLVHVRSRNPDKTFRLACRAILQSTSPLGF